MFIKKSVEGPKGGTTERNGETAKVHTLQGGEKSIVEARERTRSPALALSPKIKLIYACLLGPGGTICRESTKGSVWGEQRAKWAQTCEGRFSSGSGSGPRHGGRAVLVWKVCRETTEAGV